MAAPSLPVSAAALRRADLLFKKGDQASAPREAAYALLCDEGGTFDGGALLKKCLAAVAQNPYGALGLTTDATDAQIKNCLLYTSPSPRDQRGSRMPSSA